MGHSFIAASLVGALAVATGVQALSKVTASGRYLYTDDGNRFYIKGVAYQEQGDIVPDPNDPFLEPSNFIDPLANGTACARDLPYLKQLGVNAIRAYSVDGTLNHDDCMKAFSDAGIYTIIDLTLPINGSIDRLAPAWTTNLLDLYTTTIDAFSSYDNVLAYNIGNEVVIQAARSDAASFIKAAARDIKSYLKSKKSSALVGYAAVNGAANWIDPLANYLSCDPSGGGNGDTAIDIYGLNNYNWCGDSSFHAAYAGIYGQFAGYNVPAYFSEYGCITNPPRIWTEVASLFSTDMSDVWSGGVAFSYFPARSGQGEFGMVTISNDGTTVTTSADFDALKNEYNGVTPPNSPSKSAAGSTVYPSCPTQNSTFLASNTLPPTPNDAACNCLESTLSCQFTPQTNNFTIVVGELIDTACGLLIQKGGNCDDISGNGTTGVYGRVASCDPSTKLSFVFSEFYEITGRNSASCSFAGNATVNPAAPASASAANSAASSCLSNPSAVFTPSPPATTAGGKPTGSGSSNPHSGASINAPAFIGFGSAVAVGMTSALWTLGLF